MSETHKKLRELLAKGNVGPWRLAVGEETVDWWGKGDKEGVVVVCDTPNHLEESKKDNRAVCSTNDDGLPTEADTANAELIVEAVNALPALLDRIDTLESAVQSARDEALDEAAEILDAQEELHHLASAIRALKTEAPKHG